MHLLVDHPDVYKKIDDAAIMIWDLEHAMYDCGFLKKDNHSLARFHQTLLDLAAYSQVTQGVFMFAEYIVSKRSICYFLESENYVGFMHSKCGLLLSEFAGADFQRDPPLLYRVHTPSDIEQRAQYIVKRGQSIASKRGLSPAGKSGGKKNRTTQTYKKKMAALQSAIRTIFLSADSCSKGEFRLKSLFVHVLKYNAHVDNPDHRYTNSWNLPTSQQDMIEEALSAHSTDGVARLPFCEHESLADHGDVISLDVQFNVLSSLPNYHRGQYPVIGTTKLSSLCTHVSLQQHFAYQPPREKADSDSHSSLFLPLSVRNRFIYFTKKDVAKDRQRLLSYHCRQMKMSQMCCDRTEDSIGQHAKRTRLHSTAPHNRVCAALY